ncbi:MAG: peptidoglycan DD-metalloendopeptidase family protein [Elusimicrobiota bacterium]|nr:peptidoglycan DD-metalloendopeptidase family protein [Elusimicrobiota bacterium]
MRRAALYGGAALVVWSGHAVLDGLRADSRLPPPRLRPDAVEGRLGERTLIAALRAAGCGAREASALGAAAAAAVAARRLDPRTGFRLERGDDGRLRHLTLVSGRRRVVVTPADGGGLRSVLRLDPVASVERVASGKVRGSLWASMAAAGVPAEAILGFAETFQWTVDFLTESRDGDHFALAWSERVAAGRVLERVLQAGAYEGRATGPRTAVLFDGDYYDASGESLKRMFLRAPLRFARVSSRFNPRRRHPILRVNRPHHGTDYAAPTGTPVSAVADGVVTQASRERGFGNVVKIRHDAVYSTLYAHLSCFAPGLRRGARVEQGKVIGFVGATGLATGPHLHFQIEKNGRWADYLALDLPFARSVPRARRAAFIAARDRFMPELTLVRAAAGGRRPPSAGS